MSTHSPEISFDEFLSKSLVAAGVLLAIPAAFSAYFVSRVLWSSWPWQYFPSYLLGWLAFCAIGFLLLWRTIHFVRSPPKTRGPRLLWPGIAAYLGIFLLALSVTWVASEYRYAQYYQAVSPEASSVGPSDLLLPGILLLIPAWAFALSSALCFRRQCA